MDGLGCGVDNVEKTFVGAHLELLAALFVDVRRTVDGELLDTRRQRNGSANLGAGPFRRVHDLTRRRIENSMVERLETYANIRSEEHTSELQSPDHLVCRLLLEKKNRK